MVAPRFQPPLPGVQRIPDFQQFQAQQQQLGSQVGPTKFDTFLADPGRATNAFMAGGGPGSAFSALSAPQTGSNLTLNQPGSQQPAAPAGAAPNVNPGLYSGGRAAWDDTDMGDLGGATYDPNRGWVATGQALQAGYKLGKTGATLPVGYNATQDLDRHEYGGKFAEPSWRRVNRWAGDYQAAGYDPQTAYNMALSRLKNDYEQSQKDWHRSGFDLTNVTASPGGQAYAQGGQIGGGQPAPGGAPAPGAAPAPGGQVGTAYTSEPNGGGAAGGGVGGASEVQAGYYLDKPDFALKQLLKQRGIDVDQKGLVGSYLRSKYLEPMKALAAVSGLTGSGNATGEIEGLMNQLGGALFGKAGGLGDLGQQLANAIMSNPTLADQSDEDLMQLMETIGFIGNMGNNQYIASGNKNRYQDVTNAFEDRFFQGLNGGEMPSFREFMQQRNFRPY